MKRNLEASIARGLAAWVDLVRRRAVWVVLAVLVASAAALPPAIGRLGMHVDPLEMLRPELPYRQLRAEYFQAFPRERHVLVLVIDAETPDAARDVAETVAARLREDPGLFPSVFVPGGGAFLERHGLLYRDTDELDDLADRLAEFQPYIAELSRDPSLRGFFDLLGDAVLLAEGSREEDLMSVLDRAGEVMAARLAGRAMSLSWQDLLFGDASEGRSRRLVVVQPALDHAELQPAREAILAVRRLAGELGLDGGHGPRLRLTGNLALNFEEIEVLRAQGRRAGILSFLLVAVILLYALRRPSMVVFTLFTLLVGLGWALAFAALAIGHLNMVSVAFAVLFIGLGVDFAIHLCLRYRELIGEGRDHAPALRETAEDVGASLLLCATTTAVGFYAFAPTDYLGVAELGIIAGTGMFISVFFTLTLLPALLTLRPIEPGRAPQPARRTGGRLRGLPVRYPLPIVVAAGLVAAGALVLLPGVHFDHNPLRVRDPSTESVRTMNELLEDAATSPWTVEIVERDLESAGRLAERIRDLDVVERALTASDFVPEAQEEKLAILDDVALFLGPAPSDARRRPAPTPGEQRAAVADLLAKLDERLARGGDAELVAVLTRFRATLARVDAREHAAPDASRLGGLEADLLGTLPGRLRLLREALSAGPVALVDLPEGLRERMLAPDGRARVQVLPREDLSDNRALAHFVDTVSRLSPRVTGPAAGLLEAGRAIAGAFRQALVSALLVIALLLLVIWRRVGDTALVLVPLLLAAALTVAASVFFDIPFNFADVIVVPLLLGIGVDSGIHLVHRYRADVEAGGDLLHTSTARAVLYSALTTMASFGSLGIATHRGMASMGQLLTLGLCIMLLCNLLVLPALIELSRRRAGTG